MMLLKACPRCGGDLHVTTDMYGPYHQCIQCGHIVDLPKNPVGAAPSVPAGKETTDAAA